VLSFCFFVLFFFFVARHKKFYGSACGPLPALCFVLPRWTKPTCVFGPNELEENPRGCASRSTQVQSRTDGLLLAQIAPAVRSMPAESYTQEGTCQTRPLRRPAPRAPSARSSGPLASSFFAAATTTPPWPHSRYVPSPLPSSLRLLDSSWTFATFILRSP